MTRKHVRAKPLRRICAGIAATVALAAAAAAAQDAPPVAAVAPVAPVPPLHAELVGRSAGGRAIRLVRVGDPAALRKVLVVGCVHGTERAGLAIVKALRAVVPPTGVQLLVLDELNPDGCSGSPRRGNADGVDLNRNFPRDWRALHGVYESGPRSSSEPETRAAEALILRERPSVSIWYHQHLDWVDLQWGSSVRLMELYATTSGMRATRTPLLGGTAVRWEDHRLPGRTAFVVELPPGRLSAAAVRRHVAAIAALATAIAPAATQ
jgi:murein peptide amidase A